MQEHQTPAQQTHRAQANKPTAQNLPKISNSKKAVGYGHDIDGHDSELYYNRDVCIGQYQPPRQHTQTDHGSDENNSQLHAGKINRGRDPPFHAQYTPAVRSKQTLS